jgi:hypothetical protein
MVADADRALADRILVGATLEDLAAFGEIPAARELEALVEHMEKRVGRSLSAEDLRHMATHWRDLATAAEAEAKHRPSRMRVHGILASLAKATDPVSVASYLTEANEPAPPAPRLGAQPLADGVNCTCGKKPGTPGRHKDGCARREARLALRAQPEGAR